MIKSPQTIALDRVCELADTSATVYADLAELVADDAGAERLSECAEARAQATNDLIVARQEAGELPAAGDPEKAALHALGLKLSSLVSDTDAMVHSLREMDDELRVAVSEALAVDPVDTVAAALHAVITSIEEATARLSEF